MSELEHMSKEELIAAIRALELRSQQALRARDDVLSFAAHDMRNLLASVQAGLGTVVRGAHPEERRRGWKYLERVYRVSEQMNRMVDDLLDLASVDSGRVSLQCTEHEVTDVLSRAMDIVAPMAADSGVSLTIKPFAEPVQVYCDLGRVTQIVGNIVGNAVKFTPKGGSIVMSCSRAQRHVLFAVRDTGGGIPPDAVGRIFERHWQAAETAHKGRGLGLFLAKRLVEAQGGTIWAESQLGFGTTLFFTLPAARPAKPASLIDAATPSSLIDDRVDDLVELRRSEGLV